MSAFSDTITALETKIQTVLGSEWKELAYKYNFEKNNLNDAEKGFGATYGPATTVGVATALKRITYDQGFNVILSDTYSPADETEVNLATVINSLYEKHEQISKEVYQKKLDAPDVVLVVQDISVEQPIVFDEVVYLNATYTIKHKVQVQ